MKLFFICKDYPGYDFEIGPMESVIVGRKPTMEELLGYPELKRHKMINHLTRTKPEIQHRLIVIPLTSVQRVAFHLFHDGQICWLEGFTSRGGDPFVNGKTTNDIIVSIGDGDILHLCELTFFINNKNT